MIKVSINNTQQTFAVGTTISSAIQTLDYDSDAMLGVAVNTVFVPKDQWENTEINEHDKIDILNPVSGG